MIDEMKLVKIARELIGCDNIDMETKRETVEEWDSLTHVMLIAAVAEDLNIRIPVEETAKIQCLGDFIKYA